MHRRLEGQSNVPLTLYNIKIVGKGVELMKYIIYHSNDKVSRADGRKELLKQVTDNIYIKTNTVESLNVAVATSIILYELNK